MNISWKFSEQPYSVIIHDTCRIFDDNANPSYAVIRALNVHNVEDILLTPSDLD